MTMMKLGLGAVLAGAMVTACSDPGSPGMYSAVDGTSPGSSGGTSAAGSSGGTSGGAGSSGGAIDGGTADGGAPSAAEAPCTLDAKSYGSMKMWVCVPNGMPPGPAGLVVAMHGYTQGVVDPASPNQAWGFKSTSQWATLAQQHKFYVIFPDKGTSAFSWYALFGTSGIARTDLEPSGIASMVKDVSAKYSIDAAKVFANGLSAGARAARTAARRHAQRSERREAADGRGPATTPRLLVFQGDADGAVTPENMADVVQQWKGATGITGAGTTSTRKGHDHTEYTMDGQTQLATILMHGIGHGTSVDLDPGADQGGWDPVPSQTASSDANAKQD